jgi:hypothetical protein
MKNSCRNRTEAEASTGQQKIDEKQLQKRKQKRKPVQDNKEQLRKSAAKVDPTDYLNLHRRSLQKKAR